MSSGRKPIRCLVIQLARLGDTLQSLMALRAAKQLYPELEIHFVARQRFSAAAKRVPWLENVITLPSEDLLGPILEGRKSQADGIRDLARWVAPLVREPWDFVINWSYSEASSYLTALLPGRVKLGYSRRKDLSFSSSDGWSNYIQGIVQGSLPQNIHLTDILTTQILTALQIHVGDPANEGDAPVTSKSFFSLEIGGEDVASAQWCRGDVSRKWLGIQLGAGNESKAWAPESWARLCAHILSKHPETSIVLLGGRGDQGKARKIVAALSQEGFDPKRILSMAGETDFDLWASIVGRCQWLFSGDTAATHLASVLGTRVMNVSIGPVRYAETGPYGNGHYVVAPATPCRACQAESASEETHSCRDTVSPEAVYGAWSYATNEWSHRRSVSVHRHFASLGWPSVADSVLVFRSKIRHTNDGGGVTYEPLTKQPLDLDGWTGMVIGHVARSWYCGWVPPIGQELSRDRISPALIRTLREMAESSELLSKICEEASRTALLLNQKSAKLRSEKVMRVGDRDELRDLGKKLMELDGLIERLARTHPPLRAYSQMQKVLMHNLSAEQLSELGKESADCYRQIGDGVAILRDWLKHTLDLAKPKALRPAPSLALEGPAT